MKSITRLTTIAVVMALILGLVPPTVQAASEIKVEWLVEPALEFEWISSFCEGLALAKKDDKWGYIDKNANIAIALEYSTAGDFSGGLAPVSKDNKYGYIDKTGNIVIPLEYDNAVSFTEGLGCVVKDGKQGYLNKSGNVAIPLEYDGAEPFSEGLATVCKDDKWGFIDKNNNIIIPLDYDYAESFSEGLAVAWKDGNCGYIDKSANVLIPFEYDVAGSFSQGLAAVTNYRFPEEGYGADWKFIDKAGNIVIPSLGFGMTLVWPQAFSEDLVAVGHDGRYTYDCGYIDKTGNVVIPYEYDHAEPFSQGLAKVGIEVELQRSNYGFIDKTGYIVVPIKYDYASDFSEGLAPVCKDGKWGILRIVGTSAPPPPAQAVSVEVLVPPSLEFDYAYDFCEGFAVVGYRDLITSSEGSWGLIDKTGSFLFPIGQYSGGNFSEGLAMVQKDDKWGFIDKSGNLVIPFEYDGAESFSEGLAPVKKYDTWSFIDKTGNVVISFEYDYVDPLHEGLALVYQDDKHGFIDKAGNVVIPLFEDYGAGYFSEGFAPVRTANIYGGVYGGMWGFIDKTGNVAVPFEYDYVRDFSEGLAAVQKGQRELMKWGFIDKVGNVVIPLEYSVAESFSEGLAAVKKDGKSGYIDKTGNVVIPFEYANADSFSGGLAVVSVSVGEYGEAQYGLIDKSGAFVVPFGEYDYIQSFSNGLAWVQKDNKWGILRIVYSATPTASTVLVNGANVAFDAYNIGGNNYFKLRDLAYILSGTEKQFEIGWDGANDAISLTSGEAYTPVGGEMVGKGSSDMSALPTTSRITLDGAEIMLTAYNIGGNNYFKLRDVGAAFDFGVDWDGANNTIVIDTSKGYTPE